MISRMVTIFVSTLLFAAVLSLPLYSYEDLNNPTFVLFRDKGFLPILEPENEGIPYDTRGKRSFYGLYK
uniref:COesterase domain-containing protein n=1 Tax=Ascaris lumbricoides TaxID=6252 RepID=A0A0M3ITP1_ASCLU